MSICAYVVSLALIASVGAQTTKPPASTAAVTGSTRSTSGSTGSTSGSTRPASGSTKPSPAGSPKPPTPTPPTPTPPTVHPTLVTRPSSGPTEVFLKKTLEIINKYRQLHAAPPLTLSLDLTNQAANWATKLANEDKELIDVNSKFGQTVFVTAKSGDLANNAVRSWYNQIKYYDFHSPKPVLKAVYFTQLVWVKSRDIGIAKATSTTGKTYVVAFYSPAGNQENYLHNVLPVTGSGVGKSGPSSCKDDYKFFSNSCYKYFPGPRNWLQASEKCAEEFASLVSIENAGEDYFVKTLLTTNQVDQAWIGLSDVNNPGTVNWIDGTQHVYGNYDLMQENIPGRKCGVTSTQTNWKYKPCDGSRGFVCRRRLRDVTIYEAIIRYVDKLWTESLLDMTSHRFQALSRHLQAGILDVYSDDDWFDQVFVDRFSKSDDGKILAFTKLRFTPDGDSPADPVQKLRERIAKGDNTAKRTITRGTLHGEQVELVNVTMIIEDKTCPNYCVPSQCAPLSCSPWCCEAYGQQYSQGVNSQQQQLQQQPQQQYGSYPYTQPQPYYPQQPAPATYPYQPAGQPPFQARMQRYQNRPRPQNSNRPAVQARLQLIRPAPNTPQTYPMPGQQPYYQSAVQPQPYPVPARYSPHPIPVPAPRRQLKVTVYRPFISVSRPMGGQYANQYSSQYLSQYPSQFSSQYPNQYPNQYPSQYSSQFPYQNQFQSQYQYPSQVYNRNPYQSPFYKQATRSRVRKHSRRHGKTDKHHKAGSSRHRPELPAPAPYPSAYQGAYPSAYQGYSAGYPSVYPATYQRPYAAPFPSTYSAPYTAAFARGFPNPNPMHLNIQRQLPVTVDKLLEPKSCPPPCSDSCAPDCSQECCRDRR